MDPLLGELTAELQGIKPMSPTAGIFSTVHEGSYIKPGSDPIHDVEYWKKGLRHSVYFTHGIRNAVDSGHTTFLELAPNPVALMQVGLTTADAGLHDAQLIPTLARKQDEVESIISTLAQLYVYGHDLDPRTLFSRAPPDPKTMRTSRRPGSSAKSTGWMCTSPATARCCRRGPTSRCRTAATCGSTRPASTTDLAALVKAAAAEVIPDAQLTASEQRAVPGDGARLVTTLTRHPGGASVQVHARIDESFTLVYDALVTRGGVASVLPTAVGAGTAIAADAPSRRRRAGDRRIPGRRRSRRRRRRRRDAGGQPDHPLHADRLDQMVTGFRRDHRRAAGHHRRRRPWATSPRTCRGRCR